ncbi:MAG: prolyl oligopeptidase family serine peptidase [Verrucomicrobiota bacterium]
MKGIKCFSLMLCLFLASTGGLSAQAVPAIPPADPLKPDYAALPLRDWEKRFESFSFMAYQKDGRMLPYRLHQPAVRKKGETYPLVLFFHGAGERGSDNRGQFERFRCFNFWEKYPCFVLAPQCPKRTAEGDQKWVETSFGAPSHTMKAGPAWQMKLAMELLDQTIKSHPIDPSRIYVTGLSMGGFATWEILQREPQKFAAATPVCGGGDVAFAPKLAKLPLWVFHGEVDDVVMPIRSRDLIAAIRAAGGSPIYTEYPGAGHDVWVNTYSNPMIWDWLFAQRKTDMPGSQSVTSPIKSTQSRAR